MPRILHRRSHSRLRYDNYDSTEIYREDEDEDDDDEDEDEDEEGAKK